MQTIVLRLMPLGVRRALSDAHLRLLSQFIRFSFVGVVGLIIDTTVVYFLRASLGLYGAGLVSYLIAATGTWLLNRFWTFRGLGAGAIHRQWAMFLVANLAGFVLNRGAYALLVTFVPLAAQQPVIATAAGAVTGLLMNFTLSRRLVFR